MFIYISLTAVDGTVAAIKCSCISHTCTIADTLNRRKVAVAHEIKVNSLSSEDSELGEHHNAQQLSGL